MQIQKKNYWHKLKKTNLILSRMEYKFLIKQKIYYQEC